MKVYTLRREQIIDTSLEKAWDFLSVPSNLGEITPEEMNFHIESISDDRRTYAGQIISYTIALFPWLKFRWVTEITHVKEPEYFVDEQRFGPYSFWHHQHFIEAHKDGVKMIDIVNYGIPLGFLGRFMNWIFIGKKLSRIFDHRAVAVKDYFAKKATDTTVQTEYSQGPLPAHP